MASAARPARSDDAWQVGGAAVESPWREAFDLAWESWVAGSLAIGAVLVEGSIVLARGRNRVLEEMHSGPIAGTLLAHAEMDAFAGLGLRTAEGLTLYTTVEPCLMCAATAVAMRLDRVVFATPDPVFDGLAEVLDSHAYARDRAPRRQSLGVPLLGAVGRVLPLANRVWSRPGQEPRSEWLEVHRRSWLAAVEIVESGMLMELADRGADVDELIEHLRPVLEAFGAIE